MKKSHLKTLITFITIILVLLFAEGCSSPNFIYDICVVNADGTNFINLTNNTVGVEARMPSWSPNGNKIAFSVTSGQSDDGTYVITSEGTNKIELSMGLDAGSYSNAVWSPDGSKIAFFSFGTNVTLYTINPDGTELISLIEFPHPSETGSIDSRGLSWSPDGTWMAFLTEYGLYIISTDGSELMKLIDSGEYHIKDYVWSPNGAQITFSKASNLHILDLYDSSMTQLTDYLMSNVNDLSWSPDGSKIIFSGRDDSLDEPQWNVYVINADGSQLSKITNNLYSSEHGAWSPDSTKIAFESRSQLYVIDADGTNQTQLTDNPHLGVQYPIVWSPDGTQIAFVSLRFQ